MVIDDDAASQLAFSDYYKSTYETKPDWQHL